MRDVTTPVSDRDRALVGAAILNPALAGFVCEALERDALKGDDRFVTVALAVAVLHERGLTGGLEDVLQLLAEWKETTFVGAPEAVVDLTRDRPILTDMLVELRARLAALPPVQQEPIVLRSAAILGGKLEDGEAPSFARHRPWAAVVEEDARSCVGQLICELVEFDYVGLLDHYRELVGRIPRPVIDRAAKRIGAEQLVAALAVVTEPSTGTATVEDARRSLSASLDPLAAEWRREFGLECPQRLGAATP